MTRATCVLSRKPRGMAVITATVVSVAALALAGVAPAQPLRLAIEPLPEGAKWPPMADENVKSMPILACSVGWPVTPASLRDLPPPPVSVLLRVTFNRPPSEINPDELDQFAEALRGHPNILHLVVGHVTTGDEPQHWAYVVKAVSSVARGTREGIQVALGLMNEGGQRLGEKLARDPDFGAYLDALYYHCPSHSRENGSDVLPSVQTWERLQTPTARSALDAIVERLRPGRGPVEILVVSTPEPDELFPSLVHLGEKLSADVVRDPATTPATRADGSPHPVPRFLRISDLTPLLLVGTSGGSEVRIAVSGSEYASARVEDIASGEHRDCILGADSRALTLGTVTGPLVVELIGRQRPLKEVRAAIEVGGKRELTVGEIVARLRAREAAQRTRLRSFTATMTVSMRLRIAEMNQAFDVTIRGPVFVEQGKLFDWVWSDFFINGVKWPERSVPKLPLLQPEKVSSLPLEIALTEAYSYSLAGETELDGHRVYAVDFAPHEVLEGKPAYEGRVWVDAESFVRRRERVVQLHLKGDVVSNNETRLFEPLSKEAQVLLPLRTQGQQVFSTGGRTTSVERVVTLTDVVVNPPDLEERRRAALESEAQIVRDTEQGFRYLVKDRETGARVVEPDAKKPQMFLLGGLFYDGSLSYPLPVFGLNYLNLDIGGKGRQANVFFGGALVSATYSDPSFLGTRADAGADFFAVAVPFRDTVYRNGKKVEDEQINVLPLHAQLNGGVPIGPYLKFSASAFADYHRYTSDSDTARDFRLPRSGVTLGGMARLVANVEGYGLAVEGTHARRNQWEPWGKPGNEEFGPEQRSYTRWRVSLSKDLYLTRFRRVHVGLTHLDGRHLDRFSKYEFGPFSPVRLRGFRTRSVRAERAEVLNLAYGWNVGSALRFEVFYDSAWITDRRLNYSGTYFSGVGVAGSMNGPWQRTMLRFEVGFPAAGHGIRGFVLNAVVFRLPR